MEDQVEVVDMEDPQEEVEALEVDHLDMEDQVEEEAAVVMEGHQEEVVASEADPLDMEGLQVEVVHQAMVVDPLVDFQEAVLAVVIAHLLQPLLKHIQLPHQLLHQFTVPHRHLQRNHTALQLPLHLIVLLLCQ